jgi:hypothetical protein
MGTKTYIFPDVATAENAAAAIFKHIKKQDGQYGGKDGMDISFAQIGGNVRLAYVVMTERKQPLGYFELDAKPGHPPLLRRIDLNDISPDSPQGHALAETTIKSNALTPAGGRAVFEGDFDRIAQELGGTLSRELDK